MESEQVIEEDSKLFFRLSNLPKLLSFAFAMIDKTKSCNLWLITPTISNSKDLLKMLSSVEFLTSAKNKGLTLIDRQWTR